MKRALIIIPFIASVHLALTLYISCEAMGHGLGRGIVSAFGKAPPDTWFDNFMSTMSDVLLLPVGIIFGWLPQTTGNGIFDGILFWTLMVLNSVAWGTTIYFMVRQINTLFRQNLART
jgi:phosphotransferase system  glucose/maltose/N-acetylglucosamine-specific IIC component